MRACEWEIQFRNSRSIRRNDITFDLIWMFRYFYCFFFARLLLRFLMSQRRRISTLARASFGIKLWSKVRTKLEVWFETQCAPIRRQSTIFLTDKWNENLAFRFVFRFLPNFQHSFPTKYFQRSAKNTINLSFMFVKHLCSHPQQTTYKRCRLWKATVSIESGRRNGIFESFN